MTLSLLSTHIQAGKTEYLHTATDLVAYPKNAHNRPFKPPFIDANGYFIIHQNIRDIGNHVTEDGDPISLKQDIELVLQLMNQVENINIQTVGEGHSILHVAVMLGDTYLDFVKAIVERGQALGLNLEARNANGDRAVDIALKRGFGRIAHYLSSIMGIEYNRDLLRSETSSSAGPQSTSSGRTQWASSTVSQEDATVSVTQPTLSASATTSSNIPASIASLSTLSSSSSTALGTQQAEAVAVQQEREAVTLAAIPLAVTTGSGTGSDFFPVRRPHLDTPLPNIKANNGRVIKHHNNDPQPAPTDKPWYKNTFFRKAGATVLGLGLIKSLYSLYDYFVGDKQEAIVQEAPKPIDDEKVTIMKGRLSDYYRIYWYPSKKSYEENRKPVRTFLLGETTNLEKLDTFAESEMKDLIISNQMPVRFIFPKTSPLYKRLLDLRRIDRSSQGITKIWDHDENQWKEMLDYPKDSPLRYIWLITYDEDLDLFYKSAVNNDSNELSIIEELTNKGKIILLKAYNEVEFRNFIKRYFYSFMDSDLKSYSSIDAKNDAEKNQNIPLHKIICIAIPKDSIFAYNELPDLEKADNQSTDKRDLRIIRNSRYIKI